MRSFWGGRTDLRDEPMSDDFLRLIPTDPTFVPATNARDTALQLLKSWLPAAEAITSEISEETPFIDPVLEWLHKSVVTG
jgi:hypothetical protein